MKFPYQFPFAPISAKALRVLGCNPFLPYSMDDDKTQIACLIPQYCLTEKNDDLLTCLKSMIHELHWTCIKAEWCEEGEYQIGWCGSRHETHILGPHILLHCTDTPSDPIPMLTAKFQSWTVLSMSYDAFMSSDNPYKGSPNRYLHQATLPDEYQWTHTCMVNSIKQDLIAHGYKV